jgi:hypothetical protein
MNTATVVTCYYKIASKHSHNEYDRWMTNFLSNIDCQLVIFTSPDLVEYIKNKRQGFLDKTHIVSIELENLEIYTKYLHYWEIQYKMDNQKRCGRTIECYVLWNSKLWFLKKAIEECYFQSDKYVWTDIGCLRTNDSSTVSLLRKKYPMYENISDTKIDIAMLQPIVNADQNIFIDEVHFSGAIFGGKKTNIIKFHDLFYERLDNHIKKGIFIGCDQQTISSVYSTNRELFNCITTYHVSMEKWKWFYLWIYYAKKSKPY